MGTPRDKILYASQILKIVQKTKTKNLLVACFGPCTPISQFRISVMAANGGCVCKNVISG